MTLADKEKANLDSIAAVEGLMDRYYDAVDVYQKLGRDGYASAPSMLDGHHTAEQVISYCAYAEHLAKREKRLEEVQ